MKITKEQIEALKRAIKTHKANHVLGDADENILQSLLWGMEEHCLELKENPFALKMHEGKIGGPYGNRSKDDDEEKIYM